MKSEAETKFSSVAGKDSKLALSKTNPPNVDDGNDDGKTLTAIYYFKCCYWDLIPRMFNFDLNSLFTAYCQKKSLAHIWKGTKPGSFKLISQ